MKSREWARRSIDLETGHVYGHVHLAVGVSLIWADIEEGRRALCRGPGDRALYVAVTT